MPLTTILYQPAITGAQVLQASQSKTNITKQNAQITATQAWTKILNVVYGDFTSTLAQAITTYIMAANSQFMPAAPMPITIPPVILAQFTSLISATAKKIQSDAWKLAKSNNAKTQAAAVWTSIFKNIFEDMKTVISTGVANACNTMMTIAPPPALAPMPLVAPIPAMVALQFNAADLKNFMNAYFNAGTAKGLGNKLTSQIHAQCASMEGNAAATLIWDLIIKELQMAINTQLTNHIKLFLTTKVYLGIPGGAPCMSPSGQVVSGGGGAPSGMLF